MHLFAQPEEGSSIRTISLSHTPQKSLPGASEASCTDGCAVMLLAIVTTATTPERREAMEAMEVTRETFMLSKLEGRPKVLVVKVGDREEAFLVMIQ